MNEKKVCLFYPTTIVFNAMKHKVEITTLLERVYRMKRFFNKKNIHAWTKQNTTSGDQFLLISDWDTDLNVVEFLNAFPGCQCIMVDTENKPDAKQIDKRIKSVLTYDHCFEHLQKSHAQNIPAAALSTSEEAPQTEDQTAIDEEEEAEYEEFLKEADAYEIDEDEMGGNFPEGDDTLENIDEELVNEELVEQESNNQEIQPEEATQPSNPSEKNDELDNPVSPYYVRSRKIQKQTFSGLELQENRMVGIWSPMHQIGVTSLTVNFAFYLAQNRIYTAVLEGLTSRHVLKDWLRRYTSVPSKWVSYATAIQSGQDTPAWKYGNVVFLPLNTNDSQYEWNAESLKTYMTTTKIVDVTLVDLPTGKMADYTREALHYLDELWIVVDDSFQAIAAWKSYLQEIHEQIGIPLFLIFNKAYSFSKQKLLAEELNLPLITSIPAMHEEMAKNNYENSPLFFKESYQEDIKVPFNVLAAHLFKGDFTPASSEDLIRGQAWSRRFWRPFKIMFRPLKGN